MFLRKGVNLTRQMNRTSTPLQYSSMKNISYVYVLRYLVQFIIKMQIPNRRKQVNSPNSFTSAPPPPARHGQLVWSAHSLEDLNECACALNEQSNYQDANAIRKNLLLLFPSSRHTRLCRQVASIICTRSKVDRYSFYFY